MNRLTVWAGLALMAMGTGVSLQIGGGTGQTSDAGKKETTPPPAILTIQPETGPLVCQSWERVQSRCELRVMSKSAESVDQSFAATLRGRGGKFFPVDVQVLSKKGLPISGGWRATTIGIVVKTEGWLRELPLEGPIGSKSPIGTWERQIRLATPRPSFYEWPLFSYSLMGAAACVLLASILLYPTGQLGVRMGAPAWNSSESWSSNVTVGAGLLNGLIGLGTLSETIYLDKGAYLTMIALFGMLMGLAPVIYNALRMPGQVAGTFQGYAGTLLGASLFTLWGVFGQLGILVMLFYELERAAVISLSTMWILVVLGGAILAAMFFYGVLTLYRTLNPGPAQAAGREKIAAERPWSLL